MECISIIVPVFQVEEHLTKCIESILQQTYTNLDIILIDDGSTDRSAEICERYAKTDSRIRVFHTENKGVSATRNYGLKIARDFASGYIAFVDGDDYLEPQFVELMYQSIDSQNTDIAVCSYCKEWKNRQIPFILEETNYTGKEALYALIDGRIYTTLWGKMYRKELFDDVVFPEGRTYEDIAIMCDVMFSARSVVCIETVGYHWVMRFNSITHQKSLQNLFDNWTANKERFNWLSKETSIMTDQRLTNDMLKGCVGGAWLIWRQFYSFPKGEREKYRAQLHQVAQFIRKQTSVSIVYKWTHPQRISALFTRCDSKLSLIVSYYGYKVYRFFYPEKKNCLYDG